MDDEGVEEEYQRIHSQFSSYIQGKSAPTTPGILSRSPSHRRNASQTKRKLSVPSSYLPPRIDTDAFSIRTAQSSGALQNEGGWQPGRRSTSTFSPMTSRVTARPSQASNDDWLHRAGLVISSEMRESKGQSWLVSRESSTSLVAQSAHDLPSVITSGYNLADDEDNVDSPSFSWNPSRDASRVASARNSRRVSRAGSKTDFMTLSDNRASAGWTQDGYFGDVDAGAEPDFVEAEDGGAVDDQEVSRLARQKGFGLGTIVDRMVGFSLFNVDEDEESEAEAEMVEDTVDEAAKRKQTQLRRRREQMERAASSSAVAAARPGGGLRPLHEEDDSGWQDAAWLLSVASKLLY